MTVFLSIQPEIPLTHPSVSVIVPVHERIEFLAEALDSILEQDFNGAVEIIVIDDGSLEPIAPAFEPRYPGVRFVRQPHSGIAITRDNGARIAAGDMLAYLDDDDLWPSDSLRRRVECLTAHPEVNVVCGDITFFRPGRPSTVPYFADHFSRLTSAAHIEDGATRIYARAALLDMILLGLPFHAQTLVAHREWFLAVGGWGRDLNIYAECYDFWYRATMDGAIGFLTSPVVNIRRGHQQATANTAQGKIRESEELVRWSRQPFGPGERRGVAGRLIRRMLTRSLLNLRRRELGSAVHQLWCALQIVVVTPFLILRGERRH